MPRNPLLERHSILKFGIDPDLAAHVARVNALPRHQAVDIGRSAPVFAYLKSQGLYNNLKFVWSDFLGWQYLDPAQDAKGVPNPVSTLTGMKGRNMNYNTASLPVRMVASADYGQNTCAQIDRVQMDEGSAFRLEHNSSILLRVNITNSNYANMIGEAYRSAIVQITPAGTIEGKDASGNIYAAPTVLQRGWQNVKIDFYADRTRFLSNGRANTVLAAVTPILGLDIDGMLYRSIVVLDTIISDEQAARIFQALGDNTPTRGRVGDIITPNDARINAPAWQLIGPGGPARGSGLLSSNDPAATWQLTSGCNGLRLWYKTAGSFRYRLNDGEWQQQAGTDSWQALELLNMPAGFYTLQVQPLTGTTYLENLEVL